MNIRHFLGINYRKSYAQCGEDLIADYILSSLRIKRPSYLDIGAHHPTFLSNSYFFYQKGCSGVCVEPDPFLFRKIKIKRPRDLCLNVGVGLNSIKEADFYVMSTRTLNTFSLQEAQRYQSYGDQKIESIKKIQMISINEIMNHFSVGPNFISLDVEGLDLEILQNLDFSKHRPEVLCVETITYTEDKTEKKVNEIFELMNDRGYIVFGDTYINTIFVEKKAWANR